MPVDTVHDLYARYKPEWEKTRDTAQGQVRIHQRTTTYLPILDGESDEEYNARLKRSLFFSATSRTVEGLSGMIFRKEPEITAPESLAEWMKDVTSDGVDHTEFARRGVEEVLLTGRAGFLVDFPEVETDEEGTEILLTVAEAQRARRVPFLRRYTAESIINWREKRLPSGAWGLALVILEEEYEEQDADDEFNFTNERQYRVLDLNEEGQYRQRLFRLESSGGAVASQADMRATSTRGLKSRVDSWVPISEIVPMFNGRPLDYVPFVFLSPSGNTPDIQKPPLLDMIDVNLQHYRVSSDYYHGLHYVGLPTPYVTGVSSEEAEELDSIGPQTRWAISNSDAQVGYLQVDANGFKMLQEEMTKLEHRMAVLGARILAPNEKASAESGLALSIRSNSENSVLISIAQSVSNAMEVALKIAAEWMGIAERDVVYKLNQDFVVDKIDAPLLTAWVAAYQSGSISYEMFFNGLKGGEVIPAERTLEAEMEAIENDRAALGELNLADAPEDAASRKRGRVDNSSNDGEA
jgi:hypothetical protein